MMGVPPTVLSGLSPFSGVSEPSSFGGLAADSFPRLRPRDLDAGVTFFTSPSNSLLMVKASALLDWRNPERTESVQGKAFLSSTGSRRATAAMNLPEISW